MLWLFIEPFYEQKSLLDVQNYFANLKDFSIESKIVFELIYHCHFNAAKTWRTIISCMHDFSITPRQNGDKDSRKFHLDMAINNLRFKVIVQVA